MKRIRYSKDDGGGYSSKVMQGAHELVLARIVGLDWWVENDQGTRLREGSAKTDAEVKKAVKKALKEVGVQFLDEVRETKGETSE